MGACGCCPRRAHQEGHLLRLWQGWLTVPWLSGETTRFLLNKHLPPRRGSGIWGRVGQAEPGCRVSRGLSGQQHHVRTALHAGGDPKLSSAGREGPTIKEIRLLQENRELLLVIVNMMKRMEKRGTARLKRRSLRPCLSHLIHMHRNGFSTRHWLTGCCT